MSYAIDTFVLCVYMTTHKKTLGYQGEQLVADHYRDKGYSLAVANYTIRGGEIDLVVTKEKVLRFVEVKVVNHIDELHGYVTKKKLYYLSKTIDAFFLDPEWKHFVHFDWRLDVVFVRNNRILEVYKNVYI